MSFVAFIYRLWLRRKRCRSKKHRQPRQRGGAEIASQASTIDCSGPARCDKISNDLYCSKEDCSDEDGTCKSAPSLAECAKKEREPVCGCDDTQYISACHAKAKGATSYNSGKCPRCSGDACPGEGEICNKCNPEGECVERPSAEACRFVDTPQQVCGCNGETYTSVCAAKRDGVLEYSEGPCGTCDEICPGEETTCVQCPGESVQCVERPNENCQELEKNEVCGCDGEKYRNACAAIQAGVQPTDNEDCSQECSPESSEVCDAQTQICGSRYNCGGTPGRQCYDIATNCNSSEAYCGCDGNTYSNKCQAEKYGVLGKGSNCDETNCPEGGCPPVVLKVGGAGELDRVNVLTLPQVCSKCGDDEGTCMRRPLICPSTSNPVCGCGTNKAYRNECMAQRAGVAPSSDDSCLTGGCDGECGPMEYCTSCNESEGACVQRPLGCWDDHLSLVACGCDGNFYDSACEARKNGVGIDPSWDACGGF